MASEISSSLYATRRKELLALVNQLRAVGAHSDLDLPRIAVIGNQSAGKSSVVEAISGIKVPRDAGTCTRCPMECRLSSSSSPWSCRILIRREFDKRGRPLDEVSESLFGDIITDKSKVEPMLRRAQVSVLNPEVSTTKILSSTLDELKEWSEKSLETVPFSRNVVIVDLEGPELTDLAFIDLPGLIQNAEPNTVRLVEDMVSSHIKGNCLILVALPMTDDIENQKALRLACDEDPEGRRTIGVLTKPDMLGTGSTKALSIWLDVIEGRGRHKLAHGYYCTRQPDDAERNNPATAAKARDTETTFFKNTSPWARSSHLHRFGTDNLVNKLSSSLVRIIDDSLPKIRSEAMAQLEQTSLELASIPKKLEEEPATHMLNLITSFAGEVQRHVKGGADATELIHGHKAAYNTLKTSIRRTAPNFVPWLPKETKTAFPNCLEEEEGDSDGLIMSNEKSQFNLAEMRAYINNSITRELPNHVPFEAIVALVVDFQSTWPATVERCFVAIEKATIELLMKMIDRDFRRYEILRVHIRSFIHELVSRHRTNCQLFLDTALEAELTPYTQNSHYLEDSINKWLSKYKSIRADKSEGSFLTSTSGIPSQPLFSQVKPSANAQSTSVLPRSTLVPADLKPSVPITESTATTTLGKAFSSTPSTSGSNPPSAFSSFPFGKPGTALSFPSSSSGTPSPSNNNQASKNSDRPQATAADKSVPFWERATFTPVTPSVTPGPFPTTASNLNAFSSHAANPDLGLSSGSTTVSEDLNLALAILVKHKITPGMTVEELLGKLQPSDEYERELKTMAEVRGYFQVAYKRIIDNIPSFIDLRFVKALSKELQPFLISKFGLGTQMASERCAQYLAEDPSLIAKRDELTARKKRLDSVQQELMGFGCGQV
ncbi:hypothetical protein VKT23_009043 [Stygiomarasmius scandens]|uniref:Uncharacterized protein n=1 Tax=Marasmiellus scandens TaxID=2682957 RepID=A0ABR1JGX7_9AGAR